MSRGEDLSTRDKFIGSVIVLVLCGACGWLALGGIGSDADATPTAEVRRQATAEAFDHQGTVDALTETAVEQGVRYNAPDTALPTAPEDDPPATVRPTSTDDMLSYPLATGTYELIELPAGHPTPHRLETGDKAAEYVHALVNPDAEWTEQHVKRTLRKHFDLLRVGAVSVVATRPPHPIHDEIVWVVGFRSEELIGVEQIAAVIGLGGVGDPNSPYATMGGYDAFVVVSELGGLRASGLVDAPNREGTPEPNGVWTIDDIDSLPGPP